MQKFTLKKSSFFILSFFILLSACSLIPNTDKANINIHQQLVPQYVVYIQNDPLLIDTQKTKDIDYVKTANFKGLCINVVPYYINYLKADKALSESEKQAYILEAKSYQLVSKRYN